VPASSRNSWANPGVECPFFVCFACFVFQSFRLSDEKTAARMTRAAVDSAPRFGPRT
jgi:hypothetical protein